MSTNIWEQAADYKPTKKKRSVWDEAADYTPTPKQSNLVDELGDTFTSGQGAIEGFASTVSGGAKGLGDLVDNTSSALQAIGAFPDLTKQPGYDKSKEIKLGKVAESLHKPAKPNMYNVSAFLAPALLPTPSVVGTAKTVGAAMKLGGLEGGALSAFNNVGEQYKQTGKVDPLEALLAGSVGGVFGGGASGAFKAAEPFVAKAFGRMRGKPSLIDDLAPQPKEQTIEPTVSQEPANYAPSRFGMESFERGISPEVLSEDAAVFARLRQLEEAPPVMPMHEPQPVSPNPAIHALLDDRLVNLPEAIPAPKRTDIRNLEQTVAGMSDQFTAPPENIRWQQPEPEMPVVKPITGDARFQLETDAAGNKMLGAQRGTLGSNLADYADVLTPEEQALMRQYAGLKFASSVKSAQLKALAEDMWNRLPEQQRAAGIAQVGNRFLQNMPDEMRLTFEGQQKANALKDEFSDYAGDPTGGGIRATLSGDVPFQRLELPEDVNAFGPLLDRAYTQQAALESQFKTLRGKITKSDITGKAQALLRAKDPNAQLQMSFDLPGGIKANVEHANPQVQRKFLIEEAKKSKLPKEAFFARAAQTAGQPVDDFVRNLQSRYDTYRAELKAIQKQYSKPKARGVEVKTRPGKDYANKALALSGASLIGSDQVQAAQAADGKTTTERRIGAGTAIGALLLGGYAGRKIGGAALQSFIKSGADKVAFAYRDTLDHLENLDGILSKVDTAKLLDIPGPSPTGTFLDLEVPFLRGLQEAQAARAKAEKLVDQIKDFQRKGLAQRYLEANVNSLQSNWGVNWKNDATKAAALKDLQDGIRAGKFTAEEALVGHRLDRDGEPIAIEGMFGKDKDGKPILDKAQRAAVIKHYLIRKSVAADTKRYLDVVSELYPDGIPHQGGIFGGIDRFNNNESLRSLAHLNEGLNGYKKGLAGHIIDSDWLGKMSSNAMDGYFNLNPKHHLLNLSDSVIAGGSRVGAGRIAAAHKELTVNQDIQKAFKDANLFGGWKADQVQVKAVQAGQQPTHKEFDLPSDRFNAQRVVLASFFKTFDENADALRKQGIKNGTDFALELLKKDSKIKDLDLYAKAWTDMADNGLRTLGLDDLKLNKNFISRWSHAPILGVFVNQPARVARLAHEYISNGQYGKLGTFLTWTYLVGGAAAIPASLQYAWRNLDADSYASVASTLDALNLGGLVSNAVPGSEAFVPDLSEKTGWDPLYISQAASAPGLSAFQATGRAFDAAKKGNYADAAFSAAQAAPAFGATRIGPIPTGQAARTAKAFYEALTGKKGVSFYGKGLLPEYAHLAGDQKYANKAEINLDEIPGGRLMPIVSNVLPGEPRLLSQVERSVMEQALRKQQHRVVNPMNQAYPPPFVKLERQRKSRKSN